MRFFCITAASRTCNSRDRVFVNTSGFISNLADDCAEEAHVWTLQTTEFRRIELTLFDFEVLGQPNTMHRLATVTGARMKTSENFYVANEH